MQALCWHETGDVRVDGADALHLWKLVPVCPAEDPNWQGRRIWTEVVVCARSAAFARLLAEDWAKEGAGGGPGNESFAGIAGFRDEKLYAVLSLDVSSKDHASEGVISADI